MNLQTLRGRLGRPPRRNQRGASAVVAALLMTAILAAGALGLDISKLVFERQQVRAAVDAAAQVGAARITPSPLGATGATNLSNDIKKAAVANYGRSTYGPGLKETDVTVAFYCVVANMSGSAATASPNTAQIPSTCSPNPAPVNYSNTKCSVASCAIPCFPLSQPAAVCNAIKVSASKAVQFVLAPAVGISNGSAAASTVSCQGSCGGEAPPNPMDVVLMADRTPSMTSTDLDNMQLGIENMLGSMNQEQQYVAFGALGISGTSSPTDTGANKIKAAATTDDAFTETNASTLAGYASYTPAGSKTTWSQLDKKWHFKGSWVPIKYTNHYQKTVSGVRQVDTATELGDAVHNLETSNTAKYPAPWHTKTGSSGCSDWKFYKKCDNFGQQVSGILNNTHLASALKAAVQYSLYTDPASLSLPARTQYGTPKKVVIFETDGSPYEVFNSNASALTLDSGNTEAIGATSASGGSTNNEDNEYAAPPQKACDNFTSIADKAKADPAKLTLIMIAVGDAAKSATTCGSKTVAKMLAAAASPRTDGTASDAANSCDTAANRTAENADGDNFYCASDANELKSVFTAAMGNITGGTKFMAIDGVGD